MIDQALLDNLSAAKRRYERTLETSQMAQEALADSRTEHLKAYQALQDAQSAVMDAA